MQKIDSLLLVCFLTLLISSCGGKKQEQRNEESVAFQTERSQTDGVRQMQRSTDEQSVKMKGNDYKISIKRAPDESLPKVKSTSGVLFLDNTITLTITKANGGKFFENVFTKKSFSSQVDAGFLSKSILEGLVFDKVTNGGFVFAASVSYPQTDMYIPLSITISADGKMLIKKEELMEDVYEGE